MTFVFCLLQMIGAWMVGRWAALGAFAFGEWLERRSRRRRVAEHAWNRHLHPNEELFWMTPGETVHVTPPSDPRELGKHFQRLAARIERDKAELKPRKRTTRPRRK